MVYRLLQVVTGQNRSKQVKTGQNKFTSLGGREAQR